MVTPTRNQRKKWPHGAEWARLDCISLARQAKDRLQEVKLLMLAGDTLAALAAISDVQLAQADIVAMLIEAKQGRS